MKEKLVTNSFYHYASEFRKRLTEDQDIEKIDQTSLFYAETDEIITKGELLNININAPPTSGKSITAMAIAKNTYDRHFKKHTKKQFGINNIARDDQEMSKMMRDPTLHDTIIVTDERNSLEHTGENSSVEDALFDYFSDVMAQRRIHKISCSPKDQVDKNALIQLEVISTDKINNINHCRLYYKIYEGGIEYTQLIGMVHINVKPILQEAWYHEYRRRKFQKMDLILEHGIFRPRVLDYAEVINNVTEKLKGITKQPNILTPDIIRNFIKQECRVKKIPQSIVGEELATREVNGTLRLWISFHKLSKEIAGLTMAISKGSTNAKVIEELTYQKDEAMKTMNQIQEIIKLQEEEMTLYKKLQQEYNTTKEAT